MTWLKDILSSSGFWTAVATVVIATFTVELYCVSNRQQQTMQDQLAASERGWVGAIGINIKKIELRPDNGIVLNGNVIVKNFGPRVALKTITISRVTTVIDPQVPCKQVETSCGSALTFTTAKSHGGWNGEPGAPTIGPALFPDQIYDAPLWEGGPLGTKLPALVYVEGCSAYLDHLGFEHTTKFCFESRFDGQKFMDDWSICNICNDAN